jgi:8-oxo-dGTP pyrophosphatase MutT (NUDIX family)
MRHLPKRLLLRLWRDLPLPRWARRLYLRLTCADVLLGAGAVILDDQGRVLVLEHTYRRNGRWGIPGGYLRKGESPEHALRREVREETGLDVEVGELLDAGLYVSDELDLAYRCRIVDGHLRLSPEARRAEYRPLDALGDLLPNQRVMFARLVARGLLGVEPNRRDRAARVSPARPMPPAPQ